MNGENDTLYYVSKDYLGSFDVITDERGNVLERYSFDPWGRRRNPTDWTFTDVPARHLFDRGYTGHEHLDKFGLINMNGRVYDPWLGRFLSPDPFIQASGHSQSYNRYSYCLNNPLKYIDPSGYKQKPFFEWEMNYFNSGASVVFTRPDINSLSVPGSMGYTYVGNNEYIDKATGKTVDYETVFSNYILPELNKQSGNSENNETETVALYFPRPTPVLTNIYTPGAIQWNIDGSTWYVIGYSTIYTSRTYEVGAVQGGAANVWDYISNGASVASGYPTIIGTWAFNNSGGDVRWTGKNGDYYKLSQVKNNGGYVKSMNYAKNASRLTRGLGNGLTYISIGATTVSTINAVANGTDNTSTWTNAAVGIGGGILAIVGAPVVVTGAAIVGVVWGVGQLFYGDEINGWIDNTFGYR